ncbi:MAG TPA: polysaccharide biosynthesis tyrosine autokinase [Thermoanaerobaculia bacterium]|nr:polysaccharide biosynthesis tyrosine autokinase [Thermoanaerobaculia bacterium]
MSAQKAQPFFPEEPASPDRQEAELNVSEYLGMVRRHWKLVALAVLVAVVAASVHFAITPKEYMASSTIQIERRNLSPVGSATSPWYENFWNLEFYPTQYELLQSRGLAERVVRSLDLMVDPQFNPGAVATKERTGATTAEEDEATLGRLALQLKGGLSVEPVRSTQLVRLSFRSSSPEFAAKAANAFAESFIDMGVEDRYASAGKASTFLSSQIETLKQEIDEREAQLQAFSRTSDIVTLDPKSNVTLQRLENLNMALMDAKKERIQKESRYFEVMNGPPEAVADILAPGVIGGLRTQQIQMEQEYQTKLKTFKPEWPEMVSLKTQIEEGRQHIDSVTREMVQKVRSSASADYQGVLRQEQSLASELETIKKQAIDQSSSAVQFTNLKVEIETRRELLDELLRQQSETEVAVRLQDTRESNVRIIDQALVPAGPFSPSLRKDLTYGLLIGLLIGVGAALLIEFLDRTVKTPEEVERRFGLATLAVIQDIADVGKTYGYSAYGYGYGEPPPPTGERPRVRAGKGKVKGVAGAWLEKKKGTPGGGAPQIELVPHERPRTLISESYRSLRTSLLLSSARELKVVAVTSAMAGEGKTATASNLAVVLAQLGRPVLIMDCDLRKPRLHQVFKLSNRVGLVNQLTGTADLDAVILPTEVPNLWVLPSGPMPPNPSELLASERLRELLRTLRSRFDYVILDTPPALAVTDATLVGAFADGVVLTLRSHKVTREEVRLVRDRLRQADIKVLGAVLNRNRALQAGMARGYRYAEAYGYGAEESGSKAGSAA